MRASVEIVNPLRFQTETLPFSVLSFTAASVVADDKWVGTWASAQQGATVTFGAVAPVFSDQTLRQIVQVSLSLIHI